MFYPKENGLAAGEQHRERFTQMKEPGEKYNVEKGKSSYRKGFFFFLVFVWLGGFSPPGSRSVILLGPCNVSEPEIPVTTRQQSYPVV